MKFNVDILKAGSVSINGDIISADTSNYLLINGKPFIPIVKTINNESIFGSGNIEIFGITSHAFMQNVLLDEHPQYALADGSRGLFQQVLIGGTTIKKLGNSTPMGSGDLKITPPEPNDGKIYGRINHVWVDIKAD